MFGFSWIVRGSEDLLLDHVQVEGGADTGFGLVDEVAQYELPTSFLVLPLLQGAQPEPHNPGTERRERHRVAPGPRLVDELNEAVPLGVQGRVVS